MDNYLNPLFGGIIAVAVAAATAYFTTKIKFRSERRKIDEDWRSKVLEKYYGEFGDFQKLAQQFSIGVIFFEDRSQKDHHQKIFIPRQFNLTIGRSDENDIISKDVTVSRLHALLSSDNSDVYIEDIFPTNKTIINGNQIDGRVKLSNGDHLEFGKVEMKFKKITGWINE